MRNIIITYTFLLFLTIFVNADNTNEINGYWLMYNNTNGYTVNILKTNNTIKEDKIACNKTYSYGIDSVEFNVNANDRLQLLLCNNNIIDVGSDSEFRIDSFIIKPIIKQYPHKLIIDYYNLNIALLKGSAYIICESTNEQSLCILQTSLMNFEVNGKVVAFVDEKSVLLYVISGIVNIYGDTLINNIKITSGKVIGIFPPQISAGAKAAEFLVNNKPTISIKSIKPDNILDYGSYLDRMNEVTIHFIFCYIDSVIHGIYY